MNNIYITMVFILSIGNLFSNELKILPYPITVLDSIEKIEEIEQICSSGLEEQKKARLMALKAINEIASNHTTDFRKYKLKSIVDYQFNELGQIQNDQKYNLILTKKLFNKRIYQKKITKDNEYLELIKKDGTLANDHYEFFYGYTIDELSEKVKRRFSKKDNPFYNLSTNSQKCTFLKVAYLQTAWELSSLKPSFDYQGLSDLIMKEKIEMPEMIKFERDKLRASWSMRYFLSINKNDIPKNCKLKSGRMVYEEAIKRFNSISSNSFNLFKKPLGYAIGMCGRSMTAHFIDSEIPERPESNYCYSVIHKKALLSGNILNSSD